jgi:hypothetical protein
MPVQFAPPHYHPRLASVRRNKAGLKLGWYTCWWLPDASPMDTARARKMADAETIADTLFTTQFLTVT